MAPKISASALTLRVNGTKLEVPVRLESLKGSSSSDSFRTVCALHKTPVVAPKRCEACGPTVEMNENNTLKGWPYRKPKGFLTPEQVAALKPKGDNTIEVVGPFKADFNVPFDFSRVMGADAIIPATEESGKRFSTLRTLLAGNPWLARITKRGSFYPAIITVDGNTGAILAFEATLTRNLKPEPTVAATPLSQAEVAGIQQKRIELLNSKLLTLADFDVDPFTDARENAIMQAIENPASITLAEEAKPMHVPQEENVLALL